MARARAERGQSHAARERARGFSTKSNGRHRRPTEQKTGRTTRARGASERAGSGRTVLDGKEEGRKEGEEKEKGREIEGEERNCGRKRGKGEKEIRKEGGREKRAARRERARMGDE